jgi:sugar phosphate isomerase/epimerase
MRTRFTPPASVAAVLAAGLLSSGGLLRGRDASVTNLFYVAHGDPRPGWGHSLAEMARMVKEIGYDGMGMLWLEQLPEFLQAFDAVGLPLSQIYLNVDLSLGQLPEVSFGGKPFDPRLKQTIPLLRGRRVQFVLLLNGFKPSDRTVLARARKVVGEIADLAGPETEVLLSNMDRYPPRIRVDDVLRLANDVNRPNVGIMFDLFDYLAASNDHEYKPLLARAAPRLKAVGVVGTDEFPGPTAHGGFYDKPLGQGSFDMPAFLKTLLELGYRGPIVLETQGIPGDRREVLTESMKAWRKMQGNLNVKP